MKFSTVMYACAVLNFVYFMFTKDLENGFASLFFAATAIYFKEK